MNRKKPFILSLVGVVLAVRIAGTAPAQQPSVRERELEELVRKLSEKVDRLEARLDQLEGNTASIEDNVKKIEQKRLPTVDSEEWERLRKWASNDLSLRSYWKDGLRFDSFDGSVKLKIGGRVQADAAYFVESDRIERRLGVDFGDNAEFRRSRLYLSGTVHDEWDFKVQYDFAGGDVDFKDVYLGLRNIPGFVKNVRVGHFKEPMSIEQLTSSKHVTFMERSLVNTLVPDRNTGVMVYDSFKGDRGTWALGLFRQSDDFGDGVAGRSWNLTGRVTALPIYEEDGARLLHVGAAVSHQNFEGDELRYRARPESHLSARLVDTGAFAAEFADVLQAEVAYVDGPFSLQTEWANSLVESRSRFFDDPEFWAATVQASYFLTGEHRPYKRSAGIFDNVKPKENFRYGGGTGAWELAARYSHLNLNDHRVFGGRLNDFTLGVNWYLNPNLRMTWNYVFSDVASRFRDAGEVNVFQWRVQLAF